MAESDARTNQKHVINFTWPYIGTLSLQNDKETHPPQVCMAALDNISIKGEITLFSTNQNSGREKMKHTLLLCHRSSAEKNKDTIHV